MSTGFPVMSPGFPVSAAHSGGDAVGRLRVAMVAPSLKILGGQAIQADRLISAWRDDPDASVWLVPVNPQLPRGLRVATRIKYLRTIVTEVTYVTNLIRQVMRADVIHAFSASYFSFVLAPLPAILVARAFGKPVVLNYRSGEAPDHLRRSALARRVLASVERNVVPSRFLVDVFASFGIDATIVPNIVDLERFRFRVRDPIRPRFLSTRNFEAHYNVACTLRAFRLVQDRWPDATLTLVGAGREERTLRTLARNLALRHVTFAGAVSPDSIPHLYHSHDLFIQSPDIDNMPTSVLEAFACGLPVVSTRAGGVPAIVTHGVHGLLAPLDDHSALAAHAIALLDDPSLVRRLTDNGRAACEACTWSAVRRKWIDVYRGVLPVDKRQTAILAGDQS
jgi:glycosyltransferase involved in cell wall biosynthesis